MATSLEEMWMRELDVLEKEYVGYKKERAELQSPPATTTTTKKVSKLRSLIPNGDPKKK
jgi:hypothetical protein